MREKKILAFILLSFILLGSSYALLTPAFEASDELWHYPMVRHLADGNPLPVQSFDPATAGPWKQEASQPPLYYYLAAALTFWIDTQDMAEVRWLNPHVDNGVITADGNINLVAHAPAGTPLRGTRLAIVLIRLASVLMGATTVYFTYRIGKEVAPSRPELALGAAAINAFTPMFLFISAAVNNDNLAVMLASWAIWLLIRQVTNPAGHLGHWLLAGLVIGLAVLTKEGTLGLLPLAAGTAFIAHYRQAPGRPLAHLLLSALAQFGLLLLLVGLVAGWWYYRNLLLYQDWLGWNAFLAVLGQRPQPASLAQLWDERWGFLLSYWGLFGGVNVPMWTWIYYILNGMLLAGVVGYGLGLGQAVRQMLNGPQPTQFNPLTSLFEWAVNHFALLVCWLFSLAVVYGLVQWATVTWSSQGRLVFTAISSLTVLLTVGLVGWLSPRPAGYILFGLAGFMFVVSAAAPWLWIRPAYQPPPAVIPPQLKLVNETYGQQLELVGYTLRPDTARPGDSLEVVLVWRVVADITENWSVFVHLNDPVLNTPLAQRDMYLGQGLWASSWLRPGQTIVNRYHLQIPQTAVAPAELQLVVGLYDFATGRRLPLNPNQEALYLAPLQLASQAGPYPNPTQINFGDQLELVGYEVTPRLLRPGQTLTLTLYWRPLASLETDYTIFAQIVGPDTTRWASADVPTTTRQWPAETIQPQSLNLTLQEMAPAGVYPLILGLYTQPTANTFQRLQIVTAGRTTMSDFLTLTQIRIGE